MNIKRLLLVSAALLLLVPAWGQERKHEADTLLQRIHFRAGQSSIDPDFRGNGAGLDAFIKGVNATLANPDLLVEGITVETGASPEGGIDLNERLAMERARTIRRQLLDRLPLNASQVKAYSIGIDWEGLNAAVRQSDCPWKDEILAVIASSGVRTNADAESSLRCQNALKALDGGKAWRWMLDALFPELRQGAGTLRCIVSSRNPDVLRVRDTLIVMHEWEGPGDEWVSRIDSILFSLKPAPPSGPKRWRNNDYREAVVELKTNCLIPLMNIGAEWALSNRWSVEAGVAAPWVFRPLMNEIVTPQSECFQFWQAQAGVRLYVGKIHRKDSYYRRFRMMGHSFGLKAGVGYYDFQHQWEGRQGEFVWTGVDYSYMRPLGKGGARLGFSLGAGWCWTRWVGYDVHEAGGRLIGNYKNDTMGTLVPIKVGIDLAVPIVYRKPTFGYGK